MTSANDEPSAAEPRSRERTRERLIAAAFEVFAEQGVAAPSVETIAERAGFTRGAFYSNFESKVELFFAIADDQFGRAAAALAADVDATLQEWLPDGAPLTPDAIEKIVMRVLALTATKPKTWSMFDAEFEVLALRDPAIAERYAANRRAVNAGFAQLLADALARISVRFVMPPEQATRILLSVYSTSVRAYLLDHGSKDDVPPEAFADVATVAYALTERLPAQAPRAPDRDGSAR